MNANIELVLKEKAHEVAVCPLKVFIAPTQVVPYQNVFAYSRPFASIRGSL